MVITTTIPDSGEQLQPTFASRYVRTPVPKYKMPANPIPKEAAYQIINDELMLDGAPRLNLASFVTTWMEPECEKLMMAAINKNYVDMDEYPVTTELQDTATGGFSKSYVDIENGPDNGENAEFVADNVEEGVVDKGKNAVESSTTGSGISKSRKRGRAPSNTDDNLLTDQFDQLKEIAVALKEINRGPVDYTCLYNEVMAMMADGYSEDMLATVFDHLCENKKAARGFLAKNAKLRKLWVDGFLVNQL